MSFLRKISFQSHSLSIREITISALRLRSFLLERADQSQFLFLCSLIYSMVNWQSLLDVNLYQSHERLSCSVTNSADNSNPLLEDISFQSHFSSINDVSIRSVSLTSCRFERMAKSRYAENFSMCFSISLGFLLL